MKRLLLLFWLVFIPFVGNEQPNKMVHFPSAWYWSGCPESYPGECFPDEPLMMRYVDGFWLDRYETTNAEYVQCMEAQVCTEPHGGDAKNLEHANRPVHYLDWYQADAYCEWRGKRLPTAWEWERAARGTEDDRPWPWGEEVVDCRYANIFIGDSSGKGPWYYCNPGPDGRGETVDVGSYKPWNGLYDTIGNVAEWTSSTQESYYGNQDSCTLAMGGAYPIYQLHNNVFTHLLCYDPALPDKSDARFFGVRCAKD